MNLSGFYMLRSWAVFGGLFTIVVVVSLAAEKAIQMLNGSLLSGKAIRINWSRRDPQTRRNSAANLFVKVGFLFSSFSGKRILLVQPLGFLF